MLIVVVHVRNSVLLRLIILYFFGLVHFCSSPTTYSAVAYIENQNLNAEAVGVPYEFKMYDDKNTLIARKEGVTRISRNGRSVVFEPNIVVGNRIPKTTRFQFCKSRICSC